jgi:hypothetical protein
MEIEKLAMSNMNRTHKKYHSAIKIIKNPIFWRLIGLLVGDRDTGIASFVNTSNLLVENCLRIGRSLFPYSCISEIKTKIENNRKPLRRIRFKGVAKEIIEKVYKNLPDFLQMIDDKNFFQFLTGLYEADGTISYRPSGRKNYLEVEKKFARNEGNIAKVVAKRLKKVISKVILVLDKKSNVWRLRIYRELDVLKFFELVDPLIRNPKKPPSFIETKTRNSSLTCQIFSEIRKEWRSLYTLSGNFLKNPSKIANLYLLFPKKRRALIKLLSDRDRQKVYLLLYKKFKLVRERQKIATFLRTFFLEQVYFL